jgi:2,4-didehydro-3-deoxy-L-rhamnonate hydrolase
MFKLGSFARMGQKPFTGLVLGNAVIDISAAARTLGHPHRSSAVLDHGSTVLEMLETWDRNFAALQELAEAIDREGIASERLQGAVFPIGNLHVRPPLHRPGKILNAAANFSGHLAEMRRYTETGMTADKDKVFAGDKTKALPYLFLKASSSLIGAFDDVVLPAGDHQIDWEVELALVIGKPGKAIPAERALEHVAGFMTFNDVSCRTLLWRQDRPNFRTDWLLSKSPDTFGPLGPFFVPAEFVEEHGKLRMQLAVNGKVMQEGVAGDMIFSPEEQIEYASKYMTLEAGDIFATGTLAGVGQGTGTYLKPGDIMEAEVESLGRQRNRIVAAH